MEGKEKNEIEKFQPSRYGKRGGEEYNIWTVIAVQRVLTRS